jgi:SAM-dependent methyltransferase
MDRPPNASADFGSAFQERSVVDAYHHRPGFPPQTFELLRSLIVDAPRHALDLGCGTGFIARAMVEDVDAVDALDVSAPMIETGRRMPNGDHPRLRWILGRAEDAPLEGPYALATAADSLHWMDWDRVLPRLAGLLTPRGSLAIATVATLPAPWDDSMGPILRRYSVYGDRYRPLDVADEIARRGLFEKRGEAHTTPVPFRQSVADYVESFHARAGFPRERMAPGAAEAFDDAVRVLVRAYFDEAVDLNVVAHVVWGRPL